MTYGRLLLTGALICLLAFLSAGCATSFAEWGGEMPNENGRHVSPYNVDHQDQNDEAIRLIQLPSSGGKENQQAVNSSSSRAAAASIAVAASSRLQAAIPRVTAAKF